MITRKAIVRHAEMWKLVSFSSSLSSMGSELVQSFVSIVAKSIFNQKLAQILQVLSACAYSLLSYGSTLTTEGTMLNCNLYGRQK